MKKRLVLFCFFAACLMGSTLATAQYRNNPVGRDRSIGTPETATPKKKNKPDYVGDSLKRLVAELSLDSFQEAVVRGQLENTKAKEDDIIAQDIPNESKSEKIVGLRNQLDEEILKILTPEQQQKFAALKEKLKKKKK